VCVCVCVGLVDKDLWGHLQAAAAPAALWRMSSFQ